MRLLNPSSLYPWEHLSAYAHSQAAAHKEMRIQGLVGIFEHKNYSYTKISHSYINSALIGCGNTSRGWNIASVNLGLGVLIPDVATYTSDGGIHGYYYQDTRTGVVALPASNIVLHGVEYNPKNYMGLAVRTNLNPFTNTQNTDRMFLYEVNTYLKPIEFRGEVFGLRCTLLETASWMDKVNVIGDDRLTPESYFVIPSGLVGKSSNPDFTFLNNFDLLIEA